jgi:UDP:flavonoid glycosyltransferase YjiC (YdhE family)
VNRSRRRLSTRMRILFTGVPGHGHLLPQLPLARAFGRRTDDVAIMVPSTYVPVFSAEDMEVLPAGADNPTVIGEVIRRTGVDVREEATRETMVEAFTTARIDLSVDECLSAAREWRPDLIVHDPMDYVGRFLAAACDVPAAVHTFGSDVSADFIRAATERAVTDFADRGVRWRPASWVLDICPPVLQVDGWQPPPGWISIRPEAHRAPATVASRAAKPLPRIPRVLVTFGTLYTNPEVLSPLLRELAARGAGLRVTTGTTTSPDDFALDHDLVSFEDFLPYDELLKDIDVVVAHGGAGTNLGALAAGIPLVLAPQGADQGGQAERATAAGAAILIPLEELSPGAIARAVADVLGQPGYRTSARKVADQIAAMPSPDDVAANLASALT